MNYDKDIIELLIMAGPKGISIKKISQYVFYNRNSFFDAVSYEEVFAEVRRYVYNGLRLKNPTLEHADSRHYRICNRTQEGRQLLLQYKDVEEKDDKVAEEPQLPGLFD